ncbi:hypothetical protein SNOG_12088 [Parastagonospora nodorum SN15]|uniref:Uncharacterized protein n=1 Tax=Phaeosphaeria nodorum (strain SN15 / ATCC MYA-4574 / FGSC 10173) TaxID=321614 RepID=Q0U826_PHANO|nr:hypothetical protein SNOG_12088 [Parastagonospora nodorum SN15]EAT80500.1 hypothetical protein SNOG_12088 [Parastagonospora nodorum SN15]
MRLNRTPDPTAYTPGTQPCGLDVQQETVESKSPYPH